MTSVISFVTAFGSRGRNTKHNTRHVRYEERIYILRCEWSDHCPIMADCSQNQDLHAAIPQGRTHTGGACGRHVTGRALRLTASRTEDDLCRLADAY